MSKISENASGISHKSADMKKYSNLFISKAAMTIIGKKFPYESIVNSEMLDCYDAVLVEALEKGEVPLGFSLSLLKRRKNFDKPEDAVKESDMHTSKSLWRKWGDVRTMIKKTFIPIYNEIVTTGILPTEEQLEAVLNGIRAAQEKNIKVRRVKKEDICPDPDDKPSLLDDNHDHLLVPLPYHALDPQPSNEASIDELTEASASPSSSSNAIVIPTQASIRKVKSNWYPTEWLTFMKLGPPAGADFAKAFGGKKFKNKKRSVDAAGIEISPSSSSCAGVAPNDSASSSSSSTTSTGIKDEQIGAVEGEEAIRMPSKIATKYLSNDFTGNIKEAKRQRKLATAELNVYRYNVALQARKDRIEEMKEMISLEDKSPEKELLTAEYKAFLATPLPIAPESIPSPIKEMEVEGGGEEEESDDSGDDE